MEVFIFAAKCYSSIKVSVSVFLNVKIFFKIKGGLKNELQNLLD